MTNSALNLTPEHLALLVTHLETLSVVLLEADWARADPEQAKRLRLLGEKQTTEALQPFVDVGEEGYDTLLRIAHQVQSQHMRGLMVNLLSQLYYTPERVLKFWIENLDLVPYTYAKDNLHALYSISARRGLPYGLTETQITTLTTWLAKPFGPSTTAAKRTASEISAWFYRRYPQLVLAGLQNLDQIVDYLDEIAQKGIDIENHSYDSWTDIYARAILGLLEIKTPEVAQKARDLVQRCQGRCDSFTNVILLDATRLVMSLDLKEMAPVFAAMLDSGVYQDSYSEVELRSSIHRLTGEPYPKKIA